MPSYDDRQRSASRTFSDAFKSAKQWQSAANATHADPDDPLNVARLRADSAKKVFSAALNYVSFEGHKRGNEVEPIAPDVKERFDRVSALLDAHVGAGESTADRRRMVLERVASLPWPLPGRNQDIAKALNTPNRLDAEPLAFRNGRTVDRSIEESPRHVRRPFSAQTARALADAVFEMKDVLAHKVKAFDMLYRDGRDRMRVAEDSSRPPIGRTPVTRPLPAAALHDGNALPRGIKRQRTDASESGADAQARSPGADEAREGGPRVHRLGGSSSAKKMRPLDFEIHEDDAAAVRPTPARASDSNDKENHYGEHEPGGPMPSQRQGPARQPFSDSTQGTVNTRSRDRSFGL